MYQNLIDDMDINCGMVIDGEKNLDEMGQIIFEKLIRVASGETTKSEALGIGYDEYVPWQIGVLA